MSTIVNRRDLDFQLFEVLGAESLFGLDRYSAYERGAVNAVLDLAQKLSEDIYLPCAAKLDANEPRFVEGGVETIEDVAEALKAYASAGFFGMSLPESVGGMQMPFSLAQAVGGVFSAANTGIAGYSSLTMAAANLLNAFGDEGQREAFLPPMVDGRWFGTMCLSEPQAGSSLSDIRTKAEPTENGHYLISGAKMWISGGDQDISENIIHMVLAKIPGGPPGVKGISLFIVPKFRVRGDRTIGERNNVVLAGLNHKMGHRGTTNTILNFGEGGDCHGYLVGEPHKGLSYMFHMMNEARIGVGNSAAMSALAGYLYSLNYARTRPQGRHPNDKDPNSAQVMIIEHADIKRLLMAQKAAVEGAQGLLHYCAMLVDLKAASPDPEVGNRSSILLDILTPIAKSWPSEFCLEANKLAMQVLGGYGYTRDYPLERLYRDNRLNPIHEGTHAIHGLDLLGRKVSMAGGKAFQVLLDEIWMDLMDIGAKDGLRDEVDTLNLAIQNIKTTTELALQCEDLNKRLANATLYLDAVGHVVIAWRWIVQARAALDALASAEAADRAFYQGKVAACRYFFRYELPKVHHWLDLVSSLDTTCLDLSEDMFTGN